MSDTDTTKTTDPYNPLGGPYTIVDLGRSILDYHRKVTTAERGWIRALITREDENTPRARVVLGDDRKLILGNWSLAPHGTELSPWSLSWDNLSYPWTYERQSQVISALDLEILDVPLTVPTYHSAEGSTFKWTDYWDKGTPLPGSPDYEEYCTAYKKGKDAAAAIELTLIQGELEWRRQMIERLQQDFPDLTGAEESLVIQETRREYYDEDGRYVYDHSYALPSLYITLPVSAPEGSPYVGTASVVIDGRSEANYVTVYSESGIPTRHYYGESQVLGVKINTGSLKLRLPASGDADIPFVSLGYSKTVPVPGEAFRYEDYSYPSDYTNSYWSTLRYGQLDMHSKISKAHERVASQEGLWTPSTYVKLLPGLTRGEAHQPAKFNARLKIPAQRDAYVEVTNSFS